MASPEVVAGETSYQHPSKLSAAQWALVLRLAEY